jgi:hypothetical protein
MPERSHITNGYASAFVRTSRPDTERRFSYRANVARRGIPDEPNNWYLREWMPVANYAGRGAMERFREQTGWSKATMSQLYNDKQAYNPKFVKEAARALNIKEYELFMPPGEAMALRRMIDNARTIVAEAPPEEKVIPIRKRGGGK